MPTAYSPAVIGAMADRLYRRAAVVTALYSLLGALAAIAVATYAIVRESQNGSQNGSGALVLGLAMTFVGGAVGYVLGDRAALRLRFQAQQSLVLVEIEKNGKRIA